MILRLIGVDVDQVLGYYFSIPQSVFEFYFIVVHYTDFDVH